MSLLVVFNDNSLFIRQYYIDLNLFDLTVKVVLYVFSHVIYF